MCSDKNVVPMIRMERGKLNVTNVQSKLHRIKHSHLQAELLGCFYYTSVVLLEHLEVTLKVIAVIIVYT